MLRRYYQKLIRQKMEVMKRWFLTLDNDGSGTIGPMELQDPLVSVGLASNRDVRSASDTVAAACGLLGMCLQDVMQIISSVDYDENGEIDFEEFLDLITTER